MTEIFVRKVLISTNEECQEDSVLCTEFLHCQIRILILRNNNNPLLGEVTTSELWEQAKDAFPENEEQFYKETRNVFSGKAENYKFSLENNKFKWAKDLWTRGCMEVVLESELAVLSDFMINVLRNVAEAQENVDTVRQENKKLKQNYEYLHSQLEDMIRIKNEMETVLLKKFILVLNEKKKKIKELQTKLKCLKRKVEPTAFDVSTDEEIMEGEIGKIKEETDSKKVGNEDQIPSSSHFKSDFFSHEPSTSKENDDILKERDLTTPSPRKSSLSEDNEFDDIINNVVNFVVPSRKRNAEVSNEIFTPRTVKTSRKCLSFEESDEDIELKLDTIDIPKASQLNVKDEDSEVDLFSQSF